MMLEKNDEETDEDLERALYNSNRIPKTCASSPEILYKVSEAFN